MAYRFRAARLSFVRIAGFCVTALGLSAAGVADTGADVTAPAPTVVLSKLPATALSTASLTSTVTITNPTDRTLHFFGPSAAYGSPPAVEPLYMISRTPSARELSAHQSISTPLSFRLCEPLSDPCVQHIAAEVRFNELTTPVQSAEQAVTVIPDPAATFRIDGLTDNRTILIETVSDRQTIPVTHLVISVRDEGAARTPSIPPELTETRAILAAHGFGVQGQAYNGDATGLTLLVDAPPAVSAAEVDAAAAEIVKRFAGRLTVSRTYRADNPAPAFANTADERARAVGAYLGILPLAPVAGLGTTYSLNAYPVQRAEAPFTPGFDPRVFYNSLQPAAYVVFYKSTTVSIGDRAARPLDGAPSDTARFVDLRSLQAPPRRLTVAADRAQVFAFGTSDVESALREGVVPDVAAVRIAARRARNFALALGAASGPTTLAMLYGPDQWGGDRVAATSGVAIALRGSPPLAPATPTPTHTPRVPYGVYRPGPSAQAPPQAEPSDPVPIDVPGAPTLISAFVTESTAVAATELRLSITIAGAAGSAVPADATAIVGRLRALRSVMDVAARPAGGSVHAPALVVILRTVDPASALAIVDMVRAYYQPRGYTVGAAASGALRDCNASESSLERRAIGTAVHRAALAADASDRRLRKLVFAVVFPTIVDDRACSPHAHDVDVEGPTTPFAPGLHPFVILQVPVRLTFRTTAAGQ